MHSAVARSKSPRETALNTSSDNVFVRCAMLPPSMSEMPTSPKERVTPSNSPTTRLVRISGMTTRKKAATGPAPVTRAASVSLRTVSLPSAAWTGLMTRGSPAM